MIKYIYWLIICTTCIIFALETSMKSEYNMCVQTIPVHSNINTPEVMTNFMSSYTLKLRYKVFTNYFFFFKSQKLFQECEMSCYLDDIGGLEWVDDHPVYLQLPLVHLEVALLRDHLPGVLPSLCLLIHPRQVVIHELVNLKHRPILSLI